MVPGSQDVLEKIAERLRNLRIVLRQGKHQVEIPGHIRQVDALPFFGFDGLILFSLNRRFLDQIDGVDFLRNAVFQHLEILDPQIIDESIAGEDANRYFNIDDPDFMGELLRKPPRREQEKNPQDFFHPIAFD